MGTAFVELGRRRKSVLLASQGRQMIVDAWHLFQERGIVGGDDPYFTIAVRIADEAIGDINNSQKPPP